MTSITKLSEVRQSEVPDGSVGWSIIGRECPVYDPDVVCLGPIGLNSGYLAGVCQI